MSDLERARAMPVVGHLQRLAGAFVVLGMLWGVGAAAPPVIHTFHGTASGDGFGSAVAFGDVNGDGVPDVIIGAAKNGIGIKLTEEPVALPKKEVSRPC